MTTLLPATTLSPFAGFSDYRLPFFRPSPSPLSPISTRSDDSTKSYQPYRQFSPISQRSVASAPVTRNNENTIPETRLISKSLLDLDAPKSEHNPNRTDLQGKENHKNQSPSTVSQSLKRRGLDHKILAFRNRQRTVSPPTPYFSAQACNGSPIKRRSILSTVNTSTSALRAYQEGSSRDTLVSNDAPEPFPNFAERNESPKTIPAINAEVDTSIILPVVHGGHRQRPSNASSSFVRTIKTASMSNTSLSIVPRSLRIGRSSESHGCFKINSRCSLDSDKPTLGSMLDEAAFRRSLKRKQIINELIMTEESYVADLKALVYLYSTLLVSTTTVSNRTSISIRRNVTDMLYTHETLLEKLHSSSFKAAARKWANTETPTRLERTHRKFRKSSALYGYSPFENIRSHVRSSIDSADVTRAHVMGAAEPADVLDIAAIFKDILKQFMAYEEYCANHETIAQELQRQMPALWSTYESGMESLNRSLLALNQRRHQDRKGLTVGDLLVKPVQRICKYPLLLEDLLKQTPVIDDPAAHEALDNVLVRLREIVRIVNHATDNHDTRSQIQRKWLICDRLTLGNATISQDQFRRLGSVQLCGVLYLTYQNVASDIQSSYVMCILFDNHFLIATPTPDHTRFDPLMLISLSDIQVEAASNRKGLHTIASLYTWKVMFTATNELHEILLSACSRSEESTWISGLRGHFEPQDLFELSTMFDHSRIFEEMKSLGSVYAPFTPLAQPSFLDLAANSSTAASSCRVILRNTHNPQDWQDFRNISPTIVEKSQSNASRNDIVVLAPKRAERTRLETSLSDVYTKNRLSYPGMVGSKGSQIIRASGTLVRKLSFASMQASFSRRSTSLSSKKSYHTIHTSTVPTKTSTFSVRKQSLSDRPMSRRGRLRELPELDTMDSVIERMIRPGTAKKRLSFSGGEKLVRKNTKSSHSRRASDCPVGPEDPASFFYNDSHFVEAMEKEMKVVPEEGKELSNGRIENGLSGSRRKRWSGPIARLRNLGNDGLKNILYSSK